MPNGILHKHTYECLLCGWRKEGDKRTLRHTVNLHTKLSHGFKSVHIELEHKRKLGKSEFRNQTATVPAIPVSYP